MPLSYSLSIVIPVLDEEALIAEQLKHVRQTAPFAEIIVVDGGSSDMTSAIAVGLADQFVRSDKGRAIQMNAGAEKANGKYLLFLHVDTWLPSNFDAEFSAWEQTRPVWGYFPLKLAGHLKVFRLIEAMINLRTKITAGATGDQCQVVESSAFKALAGFPLIPLMEDLALSRTLRRIASPKTFPSKVVTSSRRWEGRGILRTVFLMWTLRLAYTLGLPPRYFYKVYRQCI